MAKRTVVWTETAAKQRRKILKYWAKHNGSIVYSEKLIKHTANQLSYILENPKLFKRADFPDTYVSAMGNFSIYYKETSNHIIVTAFWDNRDDPKRLLKLLNEEL